MYVYNKYGISVKLINENWKEVAIKYSKVYDIFSISNIYENKSKKKYMIARNSRPHSLIYNGKYRKIFNVIESVSHKIKYFITDNFELWGTENQVVVLKDVIDANLYKLSSVYHEVEHPYFEYKYALIVIKKDGSVFYAIIKNETIGDFRLINIEAARIFDNYIITPKGELIKYVFSDEEMIINNIKTPVPFVSITFYPNNQNEPINHILAIDSSGNVWGKGSNVYHQLGINKNYTDTFVRLNISGIKKIVTGKYYTLFLDKDDELWTCGSYKPRSKNKIILKIPTKLNKKATDLGFSDTKLYLMSDNVVYYIDIPGKYKRKQSLKALMDTQKDYLLFVNNDYNYLYVGNK